MNQAGKRQKGKSFERDISKMVGKWWCDDEEAFYPTHGSGSVARRLDIHPADIGPIKQLEHPFPFSIECRKREVWNFESLLKGTKVHWMEWLLDAVEEAGPKYLSWLVLGRNYVPPLLVVPEMMHFQHMEGIEVPAHFAISLGDVAMKIRIYNLEEWMKAVPAAVYWEMNQASFDSLKYIEDFVEREVRNYLENRQ